MALKQWDFPSPTAESVQLLAKECDVSSFVAEILANRGITACAQAMLFLQEEQQMEDPFLLADMKKAVERIHLAIDNNERIVIYGDYDCDGVTSTAILYSYLSNVGANVYYYIPERAGEGYGLNNEAISDLAEQGVSLMITVDNGISAHQEIDHANQLGITTIITDHHQVGHTLPAAYAVVNPHRYDCKSSCKYIAGVGVAFKLITALENGNYDITFEQFAEIVAIGTVADVVSLTQENRFIVKRGLQALKHTNHIGLRYLMELVHLSPQNISAHHLAFSIAPRINAAGRMKHAKLALQLLLCDEEKEAIRLAEQLNQLNQQRKEQEKQILNHIDQHICENPEILNKRIITFYGEDWHEGIIGIVSSRIVEAYGKPALIMSLKEGLLKGSARSVEFFHLHQALTHCAAHLIQYGGHAMAAGFLLKQEQYPSFCESLEKYAQKNHAFMPSYIYHIDKKILPHELTLKSIQSLSALEPFGAGNQTPLFLIQGATIDEIMAVSNNRHCRLRLSFGDRTITAIRFGMPVERLLQTVGEQVDIICTIGINPYQGKNYLSILIQDIRPTGFDQRQYFHTKCCYEAFRRDEIFRNVKKEEMIPVRKEIAYVYKYLINHQGYQGDLDQLSCVFACRSIAYHKFRIILDILQELKLIRYSLTMDGISMLPISEKVDLETAPTLQHIKRWFKERCFG